MSNKPINKNRSLSDHTKLPPILSEQEEHKLAVKYYENGDIEAAKELMLANLRFVYHIAKSYAGYGLPRDEIGQQGAVGLMKAIKKFDPYKGVRLISFAVYYIKSEIHEFVISNWGIVKVATTKAQRKLFFNLRKNKKSVDWLTTQEINDIAEELGVTPTDVRKMEVRLLRNNISYDNFADDDSDQQNPENYLTDDNSDFASQIEDNEHTRLVVEYLEKGLDLLDARSRDIVEKRWLQEEKSNLQELSEKYGVSAERIRQIESNAFKKMKNYFLKETKLIPYLPNFENN